MKLTNSTGSSFFGAGSGGMTYSTAAAAGAFVDRRRPLHGLCLLAPLLDPELGACGTRIVPCCRGRRLDDTETAGRGEGGRRRPVQRH